MREVGENACRPSLPHQPQSAPANQYRPRPCPTPTPSSSAAGLAGLVATAELADAGRRVILRRPGARGVARRPGVLVVRRAVPRRQPRAAADADPRLARARVAGLARHRRASTAPRTSGRARWAEAYVDFAAGEKRSWLREQGVRFLPNVGWAERGGYGAIGHGNSVPRFHVTWGTGPGRARAVRAARARGRASAGCVEPALPPPRRRAHGDRRRRRRRARRGARAERRARAGSRARAPRPATFELRAQAVVVTSRRHRRQPRARAPQLARAARRRRRSA